MNNISMKLVISVAASLAAVISCSKKVADAITLQKTEVNVDGHANEYSNFRNYSYEAKVFYFLSNDSSNIYLCLKVKDESVQQQILLAGMDVWLDTLSKSKGQISIRYPLGGVRPSIPPSRESGGPIGKTNNAQMKKNLLMSQNTMELRGFKNAINGSNLLQTRDEIKLMVDWDSSNAMIYELAIPLKSWYKSTIAQSDTAKIFTLTVNINAVEIPPAPLGGFNGSPPGGNMGSPTSGGGMGEPPSGIHPSFEGLSEKKVFKTNFTLNVL